MAQRAVEASWDLLGGDASLFFGRECLSVTVWMLVCLLARSLLVWMRMQTMVSFGLVSHLPIVFMVSRALACSSCTACSRSAIDRAAVLESHHSGAAAYIQTCRNNNRYVVSCHRPRYITHPVSTMHARTSESAQSDFADTGALPRMHHWHADLQCRLLPHASLRRQWNGGTLASVDRHDHD